MIEVEHLSKHFKVAQKSAGLKSAFYSLFKKEFKEIHALKDISFTINDGEIVSYIGPNGAGKSTTIKILSGILTPTFGKCEINGYIPWINRKEYVKEIGVVFGQRSQLWWDVPIIDSLELLKEIYEIDDATYHKNLNELITLLELENIIHTPARMLSLGQRMRCEIAAALLHEPKILFLDEPTIGLDAVSKVAVRQFIQKINREKNTTVILTTHDMQDVEALSHRVIFIGKGQILYDGPLFELKKRYSLKKCLEIDYTGQLVSLGDEFEVQQISSGRIKVYFDHHAFTISQAISLLSQKINIVDLTIENTPIDEVIMKLYKEYDV